MTPTRRAPAVNRWISAAMSSRQARVRWAAFDATGATNADRFHEHRDQPATR